jgi:hypothetical protein
MDKIEKDDSNRESAINNPPRITYGDKKDLIIAGVLVLVAVLGVCFLLGAGFFILSTFDVGKLQASFLPTATPLPNPQQHPGDILYASMFYSQEDWHVGHTENNYVSQDRKVESGEYVWSATARDGFIWYTLPSADVYIPFDNYQISVDADMVEGPSDGAYGIVFNLIDNDNYWVWLIRADGTSSLEERLKGSWVDNPLEMTVPIKSGAMNTLTMKASTDSLYFYVNGALVGSYNHPTPASVNFTMSKKSGICIDLDNAGDKATFEFDNFVISHPNTPGN